MPNTIPLGWPSNLSQGDSFGVDEATSWDENDSAALFIETFFNQPPQPTFIWQPDPASIQREVFFRTLTTRFESGREQRRARGTGRRRWRLVFRKDQIDSNAIWNFYQDRQGAFGVFLWEDPLDGEAYKVRFESDRLSRTALWRAVYETGLAIIEVV